MDGNETVRVTVDVPISAETADAITKALDTFGRVTVYHEVEDAEGSAGLWVSKITLPSLR